LENKRISDGIKIPIKYLDHCTSERELRVVDRDFVQLLKESIKKRPMAIVANLGVNIPAAIERELLGELSEGEIDWSFLEESHLKLEVFGGNHLLDATKEVLQECKNDQLASYLKSRVCTVYHGLSTEEIQLVRTVKSFILI
jgi:hypothetical protein